ncbi:hypothetical protein OROMI_031279 [Orobanche minor]
MSTMPLNYLLKVSFLTKKLQELSGRMQMPPSRQSSSHQNKNCNLRYENPKCLCGRNAANRVVGPNKPTEGILFCNCRWNACDFFCWLTPENSSVQEETSPNNDVQHNELLTISRGLLMKMEKPEEFNGKLVFYAFGFIVEFMLVMLMKN